MSSKIIATKYQKAGKLVLCVGVIGPRPIFMLLFGGVAATGKYDYFFLFRDFRHFDFNFQDFGWESMCHASSNSELFKETIFYLNGIREFLMLTFSDSTRSFVTVMWVHTDIQLYTIIPSIASIIFLSSSFLGSLIPDVIVIIGMYMNL